jgi:hypothetical protein
MLSKGHELVANAAAAPPSLLLLRRIVNALSAAYSTGKKAEKETTTSVYPTYLSYLWVFAASLAHERLQTLHVSVSCRVRRDQPVPAHGKLIDEKRY